MVPEMDWIRFVSLSLSIGSVDCFVGNYGPCLPYLGSSQA